MREGIYVKRDLPYDELIIMPDGDLYTGFELYQHNGELKTRLFTSCTLKHILKNSWAMESCEEDGRGTDEIQVYDITDRFKVKCKDVSPEIDFDRCLAILQTQAWR